MINLKNIEDIRNHFLNEYKHPYINVSFYDRVLTINQIAWFKKLIEFANAHSPNQLFSALLHMQTSLDIHDQVDLDLQGDLQGDRNQTNQLQVLVGDFHSSYFYRLLSQQNLLTELYHFIEAIKEINDLKMTVLHNFINSNQEVQLEHIEKIHIGLLDALCSFYNVSEYEANLKPKIINELVYQSDSNWINKLKGQYSAELEQSISNRKKHWSLIKQD